MKYCPLIDTNEGDKRNRIFIKPSCGFDNFEQAMFQFTLWNEYNIIKARIDVFDDDNVLIGTLDCTDYVEYLFEQNKEK